MYSFKRVEPEYTGGGIYVFLGELDKNYFMAESSNFDVMILKENPIKEENDPEYEEIWYQEWQEKHLVENLEPNEALIFFEEMLKYVLDNSGPYCNDEDMKVLLKDVQECKQTKDWR